MKFLGILVILIGLSSIGVGTLMIGDFGIPPMIAGVMGILSGIAIFRIPNTIKKLIKQQQENLTS